MLFGKKLNNGVDNKFSVWENRKAQVWVETAIYTLIGLTIMAIVLSMAYPQIEIIKDKNVVKQTRIALEELDSKIIDVAQTEGTKGQIFFKVGKGRLEINSTDNSIKYILEYSSYEMTEPNQTLEDGNFLLETQQYGSKFEITVIRKYDNLNFTFNNKTDLGILHAGATPYTLSIENIYVDDVNAPTKIDFKIE
jgi:hypothetical protein